MILQKTIRHSVTVKGIGLHSGAPCSLTFKPAMPGTGIIFCRKKDGVSGFTWEVLPALVEYVVDTQWATTLGRESFRVSTVEHCLCAVSSLRIDNLIIELDGPELPIQDGSSLFFVKALSEVGLVEQPAVRKYWVIQNEIQVEQGEKWIRVIPYSGLRIDVSIEFPHPMIGFQRYARDINEEIFITEIAGARTFGFVEEIEKLRNRGLAKGGSLANAIGLTSKGILNPEGLRWPDEFVRHKALDLLGDLMLLGAPLMGQVITYKAGHSLVVDLVRAIRSQPQSARLSEMPFDRSEMGRISWDRASVDSKAFSSSVTMRGGVP